MFKLRPYQQEAVDKALKYFNDKKKGVPSILVAPVACHTKGEPILLYKGGVKPVEELKVGDELVGDDMTKRTILETHKGFGKVYKIKYSNGEYNQVSGTHILYLERENKMELLNYPEKQESSVEDYLKWDVIKKSIYKAKQVPVEFDRDFFFDPILDPEILSIWLISGVKGTTYFNVKTEKVVKMIQEYCTRHNLPVSVANTNPMKVTIGDGKDNILADKLKEYNLFKRKFLPEEYLYTNRSTRLRILKTVCACLNVNLIEGQFYKIEIQAYDLGKSLAYLMKSIGIDVHIDYIEGYAQRRVLPLIHLSFIYRENETNGRLYDFEIEETGYTHYYGFTVDKNNLYVSENLMVHHNSGKSLIIGKIASQLEKPTLVLQPSKELLEQNYQKLVKFGGEASIYSNSVGIKEIGKITYATLGSIKNKVQELKDVGIENVIIDECFPYDTLIDTEKGVKRIGSIHHLRNAGEIIKVLSYNIEKDTYEYKKVTNSKCNGNKDLLKLGFFETETSISCTHNHPFLLANKQWVRAEDLKEGDLLLSNEVDQESHLSTTYLPPDALEEIIKLDSESPIIKRIDDYRCTLKNSETNFYFPKDISKYKQIDTKKPIKVFIFKELKKTLKDVVFDLEVEDNHNFIVCTKSKDFGLVAHNCHFSYPPDKGSMFQKFMAQLKPRKVLGTTATPIRLNKYGDMYNSWSQLDIITKTRPKYFKEIVDIVPISLMVKEGYWSKLHYEIYDFDESLLKLNSTKAEFLEASVKQAMMLQNVNKNLEQRLYKLLRENKKNILVFTDSIETAEFLHAKFPQESSVVKGNTTAKERTSIIDKFKNGNLKIVFNYGTLTTGFDHEELDTVILGRPTNSLALYYQMCGRGCRIHPDKDSCLIIDFCNNVERFGNLEDFNFKYVEDYGWGMFNEDNLLSNIPMGTKLSLQELEENINRKKNSKGENNKIVINFGQHKGKTLEEVPESYRSWLLSNIETFRFDSYSNKEVKERLLDLMGKKAKVGYYPDRLTVIDFNNISFSLYKNKKLNKEGMQSYLDLLASAYNNTNIVIVTDGVKREYWRTKIYPQYKATRKYKELDKDFIEGVAEIKENFEVISFPDKEADDLIADYVRDSKYSQVVVVSSDSDFKQLAIFNRFTQHNPLTNKEITTTKEEGLNELFTKVLKGDSKDNVLKCHLEGRILKNDLEMAQGHFYKALVEHVKNFLITDISILNIKDIMYKVLVSHFRIDKEKFELNFKLLNLIN